MNNVCFEVKKCVGNFPAIWRRKFQNFSSQCPTDSANSKGTQSLGKNGCREKILDKSLICETISFLSLCNI